MWLFEWASSTQTFGPTSSSSRAWSGGACTDLAGQLEDAVFTVYFIGMSSAVFRMPSLAPYMATQLFACAATDTLLGEWMRGRVLDLTTRARSHSRSRRRNRHGASDNTITGTDAELECISDARTERVNLVFTLANG